MAQYRAARGQCRTARACRDDRRALAIVLDQAFVQHTQPCGSGKSIDRGSCRTVQRVVSEERAQRISRARTSRSEAYRLAQRASSLAAQEERDAAVWRCMLPRACSTIDIAANASEVAEPDGTASDDAHAIQCLAQAGHRCAVRLSLLLANIARLLTDRRTTPLAWRAAWTDGCCHWW